MKVHTFYEVHRNYMVCNKTTYFMYVRSAVETTSCSKHGVL